MTNLILNLILSDGFALFAVVLLILWGLAIEPICPGKFERTAVR